MIEDIKIYFLILFYTNISIETIISIEHLIENEYVKWKYH